MGKYLKEAKLVGEGNLPCLYRKKANNYSKLLIRKHKSKKKVEKNI